MNSIRSKLVIYFLVFVVLFNFVSFAIFFSSKQMVSEYHESFRGFLLLNEISQQSSKIYETINAYVVERNDTYIVEYREIRGKFIGNEKRLKNAAISGVNHQSLETYRAMMNSLLDESEATIASVQLEDVDVYSFHLKEIQNISNYIQEKTLSLLNVELTEYQDFYDNMEKRNTSYQWFTISLFTSTILLALLIAVFFSRGLTRPIYSLTKAAKEVSAGKLDGEQVLIQSNDEMKILSESFNQMRTNIRQLIVEIRQKSELDRLLKELELKHLQNQINPHFLFNTLNTISRTAYLEDAHLTSRLIESVSTILRYSLEDLDTPVTLRDEVKVVQEYFYIQKNRFIDRIMFSTTIDETCLDLEIPSLILQPIIENAFIHGVEDLEDNGEISLHIYRQPDYVVVEVKDNGKGMDQEMVSALMNEKSSFEGHHEKRMGHSTGIGFKNVHKRLQLFYQQADLMEIDSSSEIGTTVRILIPEKGCDCG